MPLLRKLFCISTILFIFLLTVPRQLEARLRLNGTYLATAYAQTGITASGRYTNRHVVAADPDILPIGTRIQIRHAGRYSGEYVVADTGSKILGRRLDIYMPSELECKKFGVKPVRIRVIEIGTGTHASARVAEQKVKAEVAQDLKKGAIGGAATEVDWKQKGAAVNKVAQETAAENSGEAETTEAEARRPGAGASNPR